MVAKLKDYFVLERARALTQVLVTRRGDLSLQQIEGDDGLDYFLNVRRQNSYDTIRIGLAIKAAMTLGSSDLTHEQLNAAAERVHKLGDCNFSILLFYFTAKDDRGYFAWIWEPEIDKTGVPKLKFHASPLIRDLNDNSLDEIVKTANHWFDVLHATLTNEANA